MVRLPDGREGHYSRRTGEFIELRALPVIAGCWRVVWSWSSTTGATAQNVQHVNSSFTDPNQVIGGLSSVFSDLLVAHTVSTVSVNTVTVTRLDGASPSVTAGLPTGPFTGAGTGDMMPAAATLISLYSNTRGRRAHGRWYLPFVAESVGTDGQVAPATVTAIQALWDAAVAEAITAGVPMAVASYKYAQAFPVVRTAFRPQLATIRLRQSRLRA